MDKRPSTVAKQVMTSLRIVLVLACLPSAGWAAGESLEDLPEGPIRARREDMIMIAKEATEVASLVKSADFRGLEGPAERIRAAAARMKDFYVWKFRHPATHVIESIWEDRHAFHRAIDNFVSAAAALRDAAKADGDVSTAAANLFTQCKTCHEQFVPGTR